MKSFDDILMMLRDVEREIHLATGHKVTIALETSDPDLALRFAVAAVRDTRLVYPGEREWTFGDGVVVRQTEPKR